jgi:TonB family protein
METAFEQKEFEVFLNSTAYSGDFPILWQFPKEFKRNWLKQLNARFMIILSLTFLFEVCMILFLLSRIKGNDKKLDVNSLQKRYAHLLLNKHTEDFFFDETAPVGTYLYGIPEEIERNTLLSGSQQNVSENVSSDYDNNSRDTGTNRDKSAQSNSDQASGTRTSDSGGGGTAERIGSIGLLQYISDDNNASNDELREIFAQGDRNNQYLEGSLANVKLGDYSKHGGSSQSGTGAEPATFFNGPRGSKTNVSTAEVRSSVAPLEKASYSTVAKNTELEESFALILNRTGRKASARKAEHVTRIVLNHNRSIQDCYKQALKKQPGIKGKVVVRFSVTPDGAVDHVEVVRSTIDYEPMINCIVNRIRRWNDFSESDISLGTVSYRQTYVFGY